MEEEKVGRKEEGRRGVVLRSFWFGDWQAGRPACSLYSICLFLIFLSFLSFSFLKARGTDKSFVCFHPIFVNSFFL
jgi:hypothetical protein